MDATLLLFLFILSLLLIHEMDAIRTKEWKMFIILKDLDDSLAYQIFTAFHLPIYLFAFIVLTSNNPSLQYFFFIIIDLFVMLHLLIHIAFRNHKDNGFTSFFSKMIIYSMSILALIHFIIII